MEKKFLIPSAKTINTRPATRLVNLAMSFDAEIMLEAMGKTVNLKSIMGLMSLGIYKGEEVKITATGHDSEKAIEQLSDFIMTEGLGRLA